MPQVLLLRLRQACVHPFLCQTRAETRASGEGDDSDGDEPAAAAAPKGKHLAHQALLVLCSMVCMKQQLALSEAGLLQQLPGACLEDSEITAGLYRPASCGWVEYCSCKAVSKGCHWGCAGLKDREREKLRDQLIGALLEQCSICHDDIDIQEAVITRCGHVYCTTCMHASLQVSISFDELAVILSDVVFCF